MFVVKGLYTFDNSFTKLLELQKSASDVHLLGIDPQRGRTSSMHD